MQIQQKQKDINSYKSLKSTEILSLTTSIAGLQKTYEEKCLERVAFKSKDEEDAAEQNKKVKELSSLLMALNNLEKKFKKKKDSTLRYKYSQIINQVADVPATKPKQAGKKETETENLMQRNKYNKF